MAKRSNPERDSPPIVTRRRARRGVSEPAHAEPIKARGQDAPHNEAGHMTASDHTAIKAKNLAQRGPSTHDRRSKRAVFFC